MIEARRTVSVYVCSHFSDMRSERETLDAVVFPELRRRFAPRGIDVIAVDPRQMASSDESSSAQALARNLHAIDECRPFFLGLLGERYGAALDDLPDDLLRQYSWLAEHRGASALECEILYGVFQDVHAAHGSLFYFRDPRVLSALSRSRPGEDFRFGLPAARGDEFFNALEEQDRRMADLKAAIRRCGRPVTEDYPSTWDATSGRIAGLERFAERVIADLSQAIERSETAEGRASVRAEVRRSSPEHEPEKAEPEAPKAPYLDENVQFTVYRPKAVRPEEWYDVLVFAHLDALPPDADKSQPEPLEEVKRQAAKILGPQAKEYRDSTEDTSQGVPRGGELTFVPEIDSVEFNPPRQTFRWLEPVHRVDFRMKAAAVLDGTMARGRMSVFLGAILLADVSLRIRVSREAASPKKDAETERESRRPYRRIFASYSHKDLSIVEQFEQYAAATGDRYLRDWHDLRAGEQWSDRLLQLIHEADVFQLFWSHNSMGSAFVQQEWEYALSLRRPHFVRPVYWEDPFPQRPGLPPEELARIHFQRLGAAQQAKPGVMILSPKESGDVSHVDEVVEGRLTGEGWPVVVVKPLADEQTYYVPPEAAPPSRSDAPRDSAEGEIDALCGAPLDRLRHPLGEQTGEPPARAEPGEPNREIADFIISSTGWGAEDEGTESAGLSPLPQLAIPESSRGARPSSAGVARFRCRNCGFEGPFEGGGAPLVRCPRCGAIGDTCFPPLCSGGPLPTAPSPSVSEPSRGWWGGILAVLRRLDGLLGAMAGEGNSLLHDFLRVLVLVVVAGALLAASLLFRR